MELNKLPKITTKPKKRIGRGYGSGKGGHTVGRGAKGEKARGNVPLTFAGTKIKKSLLKRLPFLRGKNKNKTFKENPLIVNLKYLNLLPKNAVVDIAALAKAGIVNKNAAEELGVKILGEGELKIPLTVSLSVSKGARKKIEKAGGKIIMTKELGIEEKKVRTKTRKKAIRSEKAS